MLFRSTRTGKRTGLAAVRIAVEMAEAKLISREEAVLRVDPEAEQRQLARLKAFKERRDQAAVDAKLDSLRDVARGEGNLLHPIRAALAADASIGEVCGAMRDVFGEYRGGAFF